MADKAPRWKFWRWGSGTAAEVAELQTVVSELRQQQDAVLQTVEALESKLELLESAMAAAPVAAEPSAPPPGDDEKTALIARADELHAANEVDALFSLLEGADVNDDDLAWRVARAHHDKAEESEEAAQDAALKERLLRTGLAIAEASKDKTGSGYALKWYAILLGRLGDFLPTKEKVGNSFKIKEALEAAAVLLPEDASIQTALGQWCYKVASISWIERNVAKALFGEPPESSYEEALAFVTRSHELRPTKKAALFAGLCHGKLKARVDATEWLERCLAMESVGEGDKDLDKQAKDALTKV